MSARVLACAAAAIVIAAASGCGSAPSGASPTAGAVPSAPGAAPASSPSPAGSVVPGAPLYGSYTATVPSGLNAAPGKWSLTVAASEVTFTHPDGHRFVPGLVKKLTANEIVLSPDLGCPVQAGTPTEGRYRWTVDGTSLTLAVISDSCQDRIDTLTSSVWTRSP